MRTLVIYPSEVSKARDILEVTRALSGVAIADFAHVGGMGVDEQGQQNVNQTWNINVWLTEEAELPALKQAIMALNGVDSVRYSPNKVESRREM